MAESWTDPGFRSVASFVHAHTGLVFKNSSARAAEAATRRAMERVGISDVTAYWHLLERGEVALADLVDELAVSESYFFRQPAHFDLIVRQVLPELRTRRGPAHHIRAWSAGCAAGEEAYSLAILFEQAGVANQSTIVATDISHRVLAQARQGAYGVAALRGVEEKLVRHYFHRVGYREVIAERLRDRVCFGHLNLALSDYPSVATRVWGMDLILCRNVLIYFDAATVRQVARRLHAALSDGGWLITGGSDPPLPRDVPLQPVVTEHGVVYRQRTVADEDVPGTRPARADGPATDALGDP